jgi:Flp pilus assembly protein TadG
VSAPTRRRGDAGQATVELALALPFVLLLLLGVIQVGLVVAAHVRVVNAAREGARAAAVDDRPGAARRAATEAGADPARCRTTVSGRAGPGSRVRVEVRCREPTVVPLIGPLLGVVDVRADAVMRVEG